ncbi:MAG TPA: FAD-dependent oxidoreductase [Bacteroidia bacterium]|nr:FAD-dependent oxidoreductase [Bacteroidia bacterium]
MKAQLSYWERERYFKNIDVLIAGSGIVGLNSAWQLKQKAPSLRILVVERGALPTGASTKNAGFACFGSVSELIDDLDRMTEDEVFSLVEKRFKGIHRLRQTIGDANMDFHEWGGFEIFDDKKSFAKCSDRVEGFNQHLAEITGRKNVYKNADEQIAGFGFEKVKHMIINTAEGQIDTGKMMDTLIAKVKDAGVTFLNGLEISGVHPYEQGIHVDTEYGYSFNARRLLICTNGFARQFLPTEDVEPARAQVLITNPILSLKVRGTFHYDLGYYYFRNVGDRVLIGGGRNLDLKGETTTEHAITPLIQDRLETLLRTMILPGTQFSVDMRWSGTMGLGSKKAPIVKMVGEHVYCAIRLGGMGIALGCLTGEEAADMVLADL